VKLVIVDSIAAPARMMGGGQGGGGTLVQRQQLLAGVASDLKMLASTFSLPVCVVNQVKSSSSKSSSSSSAALAESSVSAALGIVWAHAVNTRLLLESYAGGARSITVAKSPSVAVQSFSYTIDASGIVVTDDADAADANGGGRGGDGDGSDDVTGVGSVRRRADDDGDGDARRARKRARLRHTGNVLGGTLHRA
jgi:hypothetical protein